MPTPEEEWKVWVEKIGGQVGSVAWPTWYGDDRPMPPKLDIQATTIEAVTGASDAIAKKVGPIIAIDPSKFDPDDVQLIRQTVGLEHPKRSGPGRPKDYETRKAVARLVNLGLTNDEIGERLSMSPSNVRRLKPRLQRRKPTR
jgi:hypothetical protein